MVKLTSFLLFTLVLSFQTAFAQSTGRQEVTQAIEWFAATSNIKLNNRITVLAEVHFRYASDFAPQQYQARGGLDIKLTEHLFIVPLAYVYTWNYKYGKQPVEFVNNEHRFWQQVMYKHHVRRVKVDHRVRLEQRFIQHHSLLSDGTVVDGGYTNQQTRLRYRLMARLPINTSTIKPGTCFIAVYDEIFFSWGDNVTYHKPDQNRIFAGLGYQINERLNMIGGFLNQTLIKSNGTKQENNCGFQIQFTYNVDLTKDHH